MKNFHGILLIVMLLNSLLTGQDFSRKQFRNNSIVIPTDFKYVAKKPGHYTAEDWATVIDSTWGQGLSTADKLQIFDIFWDEVDAAYPGFINLDVDWDSLKNIYRPEVETGVSRGRFNAIMNKLSFALQDYHTLIFDVPISLDSLKHGVPIFVPTGYQSAINADWWLDEYCHFGASLAPMPDSSLFVYDVINDHPLGLERGDLVLGYDGIPWKDLYPELLKAELPVYGLATCGSNEFSVSHGLLTSAGENWHLFDRIDIIKYNSRDTLHLSTSLLEDKEMKLISTGQMPIDGVPFPDIENGHWVSWGIVAGTNIGYIYAWNWLRNGDYPVPTTSTGDDFRLAIQTLINDYNISGLIFDSRYNGGGSPEEYIKGLTILFNQDQDICKEYERSDPDDHYALKLRGIIDQRVKISADNYLFDKPIAILTGPFSISCGDWMPLQMRYHPMNRTFGLTTNGAFGAVRFNQFRTGHPIRAFPDWVFHRTLSNLHVSSYSDQYLYHQYIAPDEELWLSREDAVNDQDTVVKRAIEWIRNLAHAHDVTVNKTYVKPDIDSMLVTAQVENPNQHNLSVEVVIRNTDSTITDYFNMFDDGQHGDGEPNDNLWGNFYLPTGEQSFRVSVTTNDPSAETSRTLPNVTWFTTIGPLNYAGMTPYLLPEINLEPGGINSVKLRLVNNGKETRADNIEARLYSNTSNIAIQNHYSIFSNIPAGDTVESAQAYIFQISESIHMDTTIYLTLDISSDDCHVWTDSIELNIVTAIDHSPLRIPTTYSLDQNYPNPFNPVTMINYQLPMINDVELSIYNLIGQKVATLVNERKQAGNHQVEWDAGDFASGIYYYRIKAGEFQDVKKMILLR